MILFQWSERCCGLVVSAQDSERSEFETWGEGPLCCVLGQNTSLPQCLSLPRSINGYLQTVREAWWNTGECGVTLQWIFIQGRVVIDTPSYFMLGKLGYTLTGGGGRALLGPHLQTLYPRFFPNKKVTDGATGSRWGDWQRWDHGQYEELSTT